MEVSERGECRHACEQQQSESDDGDRMLEPLYEHVIVIPVRVREHVGDGEGQPEDGGDTAAAVDATEVGEEEGACISERCEWKEAAEDEDGDGEDEAEEELAPAGYKGQDIGHGDERRVGTGGREVSGDGGGEASNVNREAEKEEALVDGEPAAVGGGNAGEGRELSVVSRGGGDGDGSRFGVGEWRRGGKDVNARMVGTSFLVMVIVIKCDGCYSCTRYSTTINGDSS